MDPNIVVLFRHDHKDQNEENFRELMADLAKDLENLIMTCKRNATYLSKTSQNELLLCIKKYIQQEIVNNIKSQKRSHFFGLSADDVTDVYYWEQLDIIVVYVKDGEHTERFLEFVPCEDIKGKSICNYLVKARQYSDLDHKILMALEICQEKWTAAQFCLKTENEKAAYFHHASHELNLCLSKASKIPQISTVQFLGLFYKFSPKCNRKVELLILLKHSGKNVLKQHSQV